MRNAPYMPHPYSAPSNYNTWKRDGFDCYFHQFFAAYCNAALATSNDESTDEGGDPMDRHFCVDDIEVETLDQMAVDCFQFLATPINYRPIHPISREAATFAASRNTSDEIAVAILALARNAEHAQAMWESGEPDNEARVMAYAWSIASPDTTTLHWGVVDIERENEAPVSLYDLLTAAYLADAFEPGSSGDNNAWSQAGYDFWLTRNGHGCGFWEDEWISTLDPQSHLDTAARAFGDFDLMVNYADESRTITDETTIYGFPLK